MTTLATVTAGAGADTVVNENNVAVSPAGMYGKRAPATSGLTWGYYGGLGFGNTIADGTAALTASTTNYIVANRSTGAVSVSTATTNWSDSANYYRVYQIVTGASTVSSYVDYREFTGSGGGGGGSFTGGTLTSALNEAPPVTLASAATVNIGAAAANTVLISGTSTITAFDTIAAGAIRRVRFLGALTYTHNATSLVLPGATNITTAAGDVAIMESLGSGNWRCVNYSKADGTALVGGGGGGLTNWTEAVSTAAPNATVPVVSLSVTNGASDVDAAVVAKGTGAITAQVADSATSGGSKRGARAVDWQMERSAAAMVASGSNAVVSGGLSNMASGPNAVVGGGSSNTASGGINPVVAGGFSNTASGQYSSVVGGNSNNATATNAAVGGGSSNVASAQNATVPGGASNTADGLQSFAFGRGAIARGLIGAVVHAPSVPFTAGESQSMVLEFVYVTSDSTPSALTADNGAAGAANQLVLPNAGAYAFKGMVVVRQNTTGDCKAWDFAGVIRRGANAAATALVAAVTPTVIAGDSGLSATSLSVSADTTNGALTITATGENSKTMRWFGKVDSVQIVG